MVAAKPRDRLDAARIAAGGRSVPPVNSVLFYAALKRHGIPASLRIYPSGGHGGALDPAHIYRAQWRADILDWLAMLAHEDQKPTSKPR